jgi:hypothetical protein
MALTGSNMPKQIKGVPIKQRPTILPPLTKQPKPVKAPQSDVPIGKIPGKRG